jgi:transposase
VALREVHFRYPGGPADALAGVNLKAGPGQLVALVGPSGAGKNTISYLIPGDVVHGDVGARPAAPRRPDRYCARTVADVPAAGRPVVVRVRVRRMRCPVPGCTVQTFREQVPSVLDRYQRRTTRLAGQAGEVARRLAGHAGAGLLMALGVPLSRHTALRLLLRIALPEVTVPRVLGVDDFALRRGQVYATVLIYAETGQRVDVLAGRTAELLETWLREHPGVEVVCRDGSGAYGEAVRRALPGAVQAGDRWHLWHGLAESVRKEVPCG